MAHLYASYKCTICREIPEKGPFRRCGNRHIYCSECFKKCLDSHHKAACQICHHSGKFEKIDLLPNLLSTLRSIPKDQPFEGFRPVELLHSQASLQTTTTSKRPLVCLHDNCKKSVAVSALVTHFRRDHSEVPSFSSEKGQELALILDPLVIEHNKTHCLAVITVYEVSTIQVEDSRSSQSVINTCGKLSSRVPVNTFWLMMNGSSLDTSTSYVMFWLYSNSEEKFHCTMELASKNEGISLSTCCSTIGLHEGKSVDDVVNTGNYFIAHYMSLVALLREGDKYNFRVVVH